MAHAIVYTEFGAPEVLTLTEVPQPTAAEGQVVVAVTTAGVNPIEYKLRSKLRPSAPITEPRRLGSDGAGVVSAVGSGVDGLRVGQRVAFWGATGAYASHIAISANNVVPLPADVSDAQAAGIGIPVGTAYQALRSLGVSSGDTLLLHAGSGAVGQAAIQLAVLWGARVIATTSDRRAGRVRELGADPVLYGPGLVDRVRALAPDGITVALDGAGTDEALQTSIELVADRTRIATIVRGADAVGLGIRGFSGGSPIPLNARQLAWRDEAVPVAVALIAAGALSIETGPQLPLADAAEAHRLVEAGTDGKIVLLP